MIGQLFAQHPLRAVIDAGLEGELGTLDVDSVDKPTVARLLIGCYAILAGDASAPAAADLIQGLDAPLEFVPPNDQAWRDLLIDTYGVRLSDRPMRTFATHRLSRLDLAPMMQVSAPFQVRPLSLELAQQLACEELRPNGLSTYADAADLLRRGAAFGVVDGDRLASAATSYTRSSSRIEVAIATHPDYRGRGLAQAAAAAMLDWCLSRRLQPDWSAANPVSKRLALRLGYSPAQLCDIFYLE